MYAVIVVLFGLWVIGVTTSHLFGGLLHLLLGVAIAILIHQIQERKPVRE